MSVTVYVEGAGRAELKKRCREGFQKLLTKAGFRDRLPRVVPCGKRKDAFDKFKSALRRQDEYPILFVDSEDIVADANQPDANPSGAWAHLGRRYGWGRPAGAQDDQAQLMVATMETWLLADRQKFIAYFPGINRNALPADSDLESRSKEDIAEALRNATQPSSKGRYHKGKPLVRLAGRGRPSRTAAQAAAFPPLRRGAGGAPAVAPPAGDALTNRFASPLRGRRASPGGRGRTPRSRDARPRTTRGRLLRRTPALAPASLGRSRSARR